MFTAEALLNNLFSVGLQLDSSWTRADHFSRWRPTASMSAEATGTRRRRKLGSSDAMPVEIELVELRHHASCWAAVAQPIRSGAGVVYNMDDAEDKLRLQHDIWTKDYTESLNGLREANATWLSGSLINGCYSAK